MTGTAFTLLVACALIVGALIGTVGVGGVLLPPALVYIGGLDLRLSLAVSIWSFFFTGVSGTWSYARQGSIDWPSAKWLGLAVMPAAVVGALAGSAMPVTALKVTLAVLVAAAGVNAVVGRTYGERPPSELGRSRLLPAGAVVGFGSAVTGTGGPVLLVPILLLSRVSTRAAVGLGQVVQLPVALFATIGFVSQGLVDPVLGTVLGIVGMIGAVGGSRLAHQAPQAAIRGIVAFTCLGTALMMVASTMSLI